jgi:hypothetical protein
MAVRAIAQLTLLPISHIMSVNVKRGFALLSLRIVRCR